MAGVGRADDSGGDGRTVEDGARGDGGDVGGVFGCDPVQCMEQRLKSLPTAEFVDDEFVLDQRAVGEGLDGSGWLSQRSESNPPATVP